jgi:light-regulated signal transduction histidine kinase (bacteriophytochrome)
MHDVIEDLLTYSRVGRRTLAVRTFGLRKVLDTIMGDLTMDIPPGRLQWHLQVEDMPLTADLECFMQIVRNLIDNAIKFSRDEPQPAIEIRAETTPLGLRLMVKDNGCGFDMKYHDRMYGIFQRLQSQEAYPGTGVGLAIVAKAAERLGGRVWAEGRTREASPDGHGATFYLEMPLAPPAQAKMSEP